MTLALPLQSPEVSDAVFSTVASPSSPTRILACISEHPKMVLVLRAALRKAQESNFPLTVLFVSTPFFRKHADMTARERVREFLALAEQLGAHTVQLDARNVVQGITAYLSQEQLAGRSFRYLFLGKGAEEGLSAFYPRKLWRELEREGSRFSEVQVVEMGESTFRLRDLLPRAQLHGRELMFALMAVLIAYLVTFMLQLIIPRALFVLNSMGIAMVFMIACAVVAARYGLIPGLLAAVSSFFTINFFYVVPYYQISFDSITDLLNLALFLTAAFAIAVVNAYGHAQTESALRKERRAQTLFNLHRAAARARSREEVLRTLEQQIGSVLETDIAFFLPSTLNPDELQLAWPASITLEPEDMQSLKENWRRLKKQGFSYASFLDRKGEWLFEPMITSQGDVGILGLKAHSDAAHDASYHRLVAALADQAASILERIEMSEMMEKSKLNAEREKLRSMLLSSVSHDLKTPLASIIGSLTVFHSMRNKLPQEQLLVLTETALEEARRLDSFITNILDMTRLESGQVRMRPEWHDVESVLHRVKKRMTPQIKHHELQLLPFTESLEARFDVMMTEQVLQNLIDNAAKYTPAGTPIELGMQVLATGHLAIFVRDYGPGIPEDKREKIFDKYARIEREDSTVAGTGLGLAICKAIMEAQGGSIHLENPLNGGAQFTLLFPEWRPLLATSYEE